MRDFLCLTWQIWAPSLAISAALSTALLWWW